MKYDDVKNEVHRIENLECKIDNLMSRPISLLAEARPLLAEVAALETEIALAKGALESATGGVAPEAPKKTKKGEIEKAIMTAIMEHGEVPLDDLPAFTGFSAKAVGKSLMGLVKKGLVYEGECGYGKGPLPDLPGPDPFAPAHDKDCLCAECAAKEATQ